MLPSFSIMYSLLVGENLDITLFYEHQEKIDTVKEKSLYSNLETSYGCKNRIFVNSNRNDTLGDLRLIKDCNTPYIDQ